MPSKKRSTPKIDPKSSFTQENFEKELKALAEKAQDETWTKAFKEQAAALTKSIPLLSLAAIYANVSVLTLSPVYGAIPSSIWHPTVVMAACFVGWSSNLYLRRLLGFDAVILLPVIAINIPFAHFYLFKLSGFMTAHWGPAVTESLTLLPLLAISVACVATYLEAIYLAGAGSSRLPAWIADALPGLGSWGTYKAVEKLSKHLLEAHIGNSFFQTRTGLQLILAASYTLIAPSKLLLFAIPALIHTAVFNTHLATPMALQALNGTLNADGWSILDRRESLTGYISVLESEKDGFRVMRCDHSILGGEWVKFRADPVAEPIYGVFVMLEAVRLVEVPDRIPDADAKALVIGLGIGTSPAALVAHGIDTTVVEIDPVVHEFALKHFTFPTDHTAVIEDAVSYTARLANDTAGRRFDYIIHDVFTGGAEPIPLFTLEFLQSLNSLLNPNGVIAINFAGDFMLTPIKAVVHTIREVFPSCRIFREHPRDDDAVEKAGHDFTNVVIFCTKISGGLKIREPVYADMLNSETRKQFLVPVYEVFDSDFLAKDDVHVVRNNYTAQLSKYHEQSALGHWEVMRRVLPAKIWEDW